MSRITDDHINYICKDLNYRGLVLEGLQEELVDHICNAVEEEMANGKRFIDAYQVVLKRFGHTHGLHQLQSQVLYAENKTAGLMLRNYLIIAFRNLSKHRFYTCINIGGLAIGIAACLMITLYVVHEFSYDRHFKHADRIYRVNAEVLFSGNEHRLAVMPAPVAAVLEADYPEVEASVHFRGTGSKLVKRTTENIKEQRVVYADNNIFKVFSLPLIKGNTSHALTEPGSMVISKSTAEKYFRGEEAVGQTLILDNAINYKITGVYDDLPVATHFHFDFILSIEDVAESKSDNWLSNNFNTYVLLRKGASASSLQGKFPQMIEKYMGPQLKTVLGNDYSMEKFDAAGNKIQFSLMPLTDIHLHSDLTAELAPNSDITYIYLFTAIAAFILVIACINFMNLSTARSANRAKEVGIRKVLGSFRIHLVRQFLTESVLLSLFSFALATALTYLLLPSFNVLAGRRLSLPIDSPAFIGIVFMAAIMIGLLAGIYPSLFLSAFKPVQVLKGKLALGMKSGVVRSTLVVFQFMISIFLVIATLTVQKQLSFIQNKKLGFNKDQVIILNDTYVLGDQDEAFKNEMLKNPEIISASASGYLPVAGWGRNDTSFWPQGSQPSQDNMVSMQYWGVDHDYVGTLGMQISHGRNFSPDFPSDSTAIIINEAAAKRLGFKNPIGEKITTYAFEDDAVSWNKTHSFTIVGVVKDFHFESLKQNISPLCLYLSNSSSSMLFSFQSVNTQQVITLLEQHWKRMAPGQPFQYTFLDEAFGSMYGSEQRLGKIFGLFAVLAILIACLGLFALTSFTAEQRTKEIGIRKVLGASVSSIVMLLSKEFAKLIIFAFLLAAPLSWFAVNWWLENYTYKVEVGFTIYLLSGIAAFTISWITMGYQSIKAAISDPVNSLRSE